MYDAEKIRSNLAEKIKLELTLQRRTQKDLAEAIDVNPSTLNGWVQKGRDVPAQYIPRIAAFFGCTIEEMMGIERKVCMHQVGLSQEPSQQGSAVQHPPEEKKVPSFQDYEDAGYYLAKALYSYAKGVAKGYMEAMEADHDT